MNLPFLEENCFVLFLRIHVFGEIPKKEHVFGKKPKLESIFGKVEVLEKSWRSHMRKKDYKGRCEKRVLNKCKTLFKSYDPIQSAYADILESNMNVAEIQCNVPLDGEEMEEYMTDFLCTLLNGEMMVRECVERKHLGKPKTIKLLDGSRQFWSKRGCKDWGIVVDAAE